uniref:J encoding E9imm, E5imm, and two lys genes n=2 Tax=plasmids TaxID=36549 RepID=Q79DZ1_9ZZZZ|nr:lys peptide [Plasmid ColE9]CAA33864.1 atypical lysis protein (26 AA) [Plasmid ColE9-J]
MKKITGIILLLLAVIILSAWGSKPKT